MFNHILVPLDASSLAECVLAHVVAMATAFDSRVTFVHVLDPVGMDSGITLVDPMEWEMRRAEQETYLDKLTSKFQDIGIETECALLEGRAAERIVAFAHSEEIDLIVLSSHGWSGLSRWNVSSVAQKILFAASASTMIVRAYQGHATDLTGLHYRRILVPLDGSQRAEYALPPVDALARYHKSQICLLHIVRNPELPRRVPLVQEEKAAVTWLAQRNQQEAEKYLEQIQTQLSAESEVIVLNSDDIVSTLHELAGQEAHDLLVLGAHGYSGSRNWPYGSVTTSFIAYGATSLLIIQDLRADQIKPAPAAIAAQGSQGTAARSCLARHAASL